MFCEHLNFGMTRRDFFGRFGLGLGGVALTQLLQGSSTAAENPFQGILEKPHFAPRTKRIQVCATRQIRRVGERLDAAHRKDGG
jgi:hypothetical protein